MSKRDTSSDETKDMDTLIEQLLDIFEFGEHVSHYPYSTGQPDPGR
jgi:hypothetical protein